MYLEQPQQILTILTDSLQDYAFEIKAVLDRNYFRADYV